MLRDAGNALRRARGDLGGKMATAKRIEKRIEANRSKERRDLENARAAMQAGREDLARGLAATRAEVQRDEADLEQMQRRQQVTLRAVRETKQRIVAMKREVDSVKATDSLQRAQKAIAPSQAGITSRLGSAKGSLERIRDRQEQMAVRLESGEVLAYFESGADLDRQLLEAGTGGRKSSSDDILAEIVARQALRALPKI